MNTTEIVFVVECTQNCHEHAWHTRHDEAKYNDFFKRIAAPSSIESQTPLSWRIRSPSLTCHLIYITIWCQTKMRTRHISNRSQESELSRSATRDSSFSPSFRVDTGQTATSSLTSVRVSCTPNKMVTITPSS